MFLQFHHKYHKDIPSEGNNSKPQQLYIKVFMPRGNLHKVEYKKDMHEIDTCYRDALDACLIHKEGVLTM